MKNIFYKGKYSSVSFFVKELISQGENSQQLYPSQQLPQNNLFAFYVVERLRLLFGLTNPIGKVFVFALQLQILPLQVSVFICHGGEWLLIKLDF
jgi:hypothetical protein